MSRLPKWMTRTGEKRRWGLKQRNKLTLRQKKAGLGVLFVSPWLLGFIFLFLVPLYQSFIYSLNKLTLGKGGFDTSYAGFSFYQELFTQHPTFNRTLVEAIMDIVINVPSITIFSLFVATLINQKFRGRVFARAIFFLPVLLAAPVLSLENSSQMTFIAASITGATTEGGAFAFTSFELKRMLLEAGLGNGIGTYITGSVDRIYEVISSSGVQILIFLAALQSISPSLYEAAKIEGTTGYEAFWKITLPMISPIMLTNVVYTVIDSYNRNQLSQMIKDTAFQSLNFSQSAAMAWVYFLIVSIILLVTTGLISRKVFYYD
ncbi:sugar ABC transporter permease [Paenibacillus sp. D2_2]|uniref:carbohydrate ABC transporter permease n=1 Tax=Paenibacillus sp. D2_2 TaxID=3073092 RepID=UPI002815C14F|nr:sugar ABC transporter permease [Paenibacillus sp. D2_2]WMT43144.1 sugar ABC transporter permease [Paenibacillus sp. D2_2]